MAIDFNTFEGPELCYWRVANQLTLPNWVNFLPFLLNNKELSNSLWDETPSVTRSDAQGPCWAAIKTMGLWFRWSPTYPGEKSWLGPSLGGCRIAIRMPLLEGVEGFEAATRNSQPNPHCHVGRNFLVGIVGWQGWVVLPLASQIRSLRAPLPRDVYGNVAAKIFLRGTWSFLDVFWWF